MRRPLLMRRPSVLGARLLLVIVVASGATGCADWIRTPYSRPAIETPPRWQQGSTGGAPGVEGATAPSAPWWTDFGDPRLTRLVEAALRRNNDLASATSRVRQANLRAELAAGALRPVPAVALNNSYSKTSRFDSHTHGLTGSVAYEVDLW